MPLPAPQVRPGLPLPQVGLGLPLSPALNDPLFGVNPFNGSNMFGLGQSGLDLSQTIAQYPQSYLGQQMVAAQVEALRRAGLPLDSDPNTWGPEEAQAQTDTAIAKIATVNPDLARELQAQRTGTETGKGFWNSLKSLAGDVLHPFVTVGAKALDLLVRPAYIIPSLLVKDNDPWYEDIGQALSGQSRTTWSDVLWQWGMKNDWARALVGFVGDVLTDPITYLTFGTGGALRKTVSATAGRFTVAKVAEESLVRQGFKGDLAERAMRLADDFSQKYLHLIGRPVDVDMASALAGEAWVGAERAVWSDMYEVGDWVTRWVNQGRSLLKLPKYSYTTTAGHTYEGKQVLEWFMKARKGAIGGGNYALAKAFAGAIGGVRLRAWTPFGLRYISSPLPFLSGLSFQGTRRFFIGMSGQSRLLRAIEAGTPGIDWQDYVNWMDNGVAWAMEQNPALKRLGGRGANLGSGMYSLTERVGRITAHLSPHAAAYRRGLAGLFAADAARTAREVESRVLRTGLDWQGFDPDGNWAEMAQPALLREVKVALGDTADPRWQRFLEAFPGRAAYENPEAFYDQMRFARYREALDLGNITAEEYEEALLLGNDQLARLKQLKTEVTERQAEALFRLREAMTNLTDEAARREVSSAPFWDINYDAAKVLNEPDSLEWASRSYPGTREGVFYAVGDKATDATRRLESGLNRAEDLRQIGQGRGTGVDLVAWPGDSTRMHVEVLEEGRVRVYGWHGTRNGGLPTGVGGDEMWAGGFHFGSQRAALERVTADEWLQSHYVSVLDENGEFLWDDVFDEYDRAATEAAAIRREHPGYTVEIQSSDLDNLDLTESELLEFQQSGQVLPVMVEGRIAGLESGRGVDLSKYVEALDEGGDVDAWKAVREKYMAEGYDGVAYYNRVEDAGRPSIMWFEPAKVKQLTPTRVRITKPVVLDHTAGATLSDDALWEEWYRGAYEAEAATRAAKDRFAQADPEVAVKATEWTADDGVTEIAKAEGKDALFVKEQDGLLKVTVFDAENVKVIDEAAPAAIRDRGWFPRLPTAKVEELLNGLPDRTVPERFYAAPKLHHDMSRLLREETADEAAAHWRRVLRDKGIEVTDDMPIYESDVLKTAERFLKRYGRAFAQEEVTRTFSRIRTLGEVAPKMFGGAVGFNRYRWKVIEEGSGKWRHLESLEKGTANKAMAAGMKRAEYAEQMHTVALRSSDNWARAMEALEGHDLGLAQELLPKAERELGKTTLDEEIRKTLLALRRAAESPSVTPAQVQKLQGKLKSLRLARIKGTEGVGLGAPHWGIGRGKTDTITAPMTELEKLKWPSLNEIRPGVYGKPDEERIAALMADMRKHGAKQPLVIHIADEGLAHGRVYGGDGAHRMVAAKRLGLTELPVQVRVGHNAERWVPDWLKAPRFNKLTKAQEQLARQNLRILRREADIAYQEMERAYTRLQTEVAEVRPGLVKLEQVRGKEGFVDLFARTGLKELRGLAAPAYIAEEFAWALKNTGNDVGALRRMWRRWVMGPWKEWATFRFPGFHIRNLYGIFFNNWLGGTDLQDWNYAIRLLKAKGDFGLKLARKWADVPVEPGVVSRYMLRRIFGPDEEITWGMLADLSADIGIHRANTIQVANAFTATEEFAREMGRRGKVGPLRTLGRNYDRAMRGVGGSVEDFGRCAALFTGLRTTDGDIYGARAWVMMRHGDYEDLNDFEQWMRDLIPFYKWFRVNTPYQLHMLFESPAKTLMVPKAVRAAYEAQGLDYDEARLKQPEWMRQLVAFPVGAGGKKVGDPMQMMVLDLPFNDMLNGANEYFSMFLPMARPFVESYVTGSSVFSHEKYTGEMVPLGTLNPLNLPFIRDSLVATGVLKRGTEGEYLIDDKLQNVLAGWPVYGRFRNWLYEEPSRMQLRVNTLFSSIFGLGLRYIDESTLTSAELGFYHAQVEPLVEQMRDQGVIFPNKDDISPEVFQALGLLTPEEQAEAEETAGTP